MPPQPNRSQSFNNFAQPQPQQPQWRPVWQNQQPPSQQNQQIKPDLSAFDSLLSTSSSSNSKIPMNSLMGSNSNSLMSSANSSNYWDFHHNNIRIHKIHKDNKIPAWSNH